jgi:5-methyltetrahydropteroyltriglutamate--homocysteine methyltransferase
MVEGKYDKNRTDQVGSLLRPASLKAAAAAAEKGQLPPSAVEALAGEAVRNVLEEQLRRGISPISDGEFWRTGFAETFGNSVSGYAPRPPDRRHQPGTAPPTTPGQRPESTYVRLQAATSRLSLTSNALLDEYRKDRDLADGPLKKTLIGPERLTQRFDLDASRDVYASFDDFMGDVVEIEHRIVGEVIAAGCEYVQIDEPSYTAYVDADSLGWMKRRNWDPAERLSRGIAADNAVIAGFPGTTFGIHICRGNAGAMWHREGTYDDLAEQLFNGLAAQRLLLEYDTERAGTFEPLRFVPKGKVAVLGLVSTKSPELETRDGLLRRIEEAAKYLPIEQLAISPQCGFASGVTGNPLTEEQQWAKLELIRDVAAEVWAI